MLSLTHSPVTQFTYKDKIYDIDLAFDTVLLYLQLQEDQDIKPETKWLQSLKLFFGKQELPSDPNFYLKSFELIQKVITDTPYGVKDQEERGVEATKQFDYVRDAGAIYASFFDQYGIDLNKERGKMHWEIFKALLDGLGPNTYFQRILAIRREDSSKIEDPTAKQELLDAQNYYAVDGSKTEAELQAQTLNSSGLSGLFDSLLGSAQKGGN
ncbi:Gp15 family bacteriophage protein [Lactobacillus helveticus]|uniref:Rorf198 protein n=1 Tax=Lactobacillus helveticus CIRM-BIA 951 TaxID=1226334 RepID=U6F7Q6_LACHE|nr:Gp15 family bacteriophage protein [Lactobacillus helveticus]MDY0990900.1 Gp15 family bacteriophage protein [Lactobacillus helveticus]MDY1001601.1 Gp15 family bacteriophage protein [Lactobacillus helveticus]MEB2873421.1 Gp15 family bacteriophage protein [Lactobacillus helveticus]CDI58600.1 Rorf198 protein [Lactobacillus helveticus CIRM-BIA 951]